MSEPYNMTDEDDVTLPLGMGPEGGSENSEIPFPEEKKPKINAGTLLLIGVFAAGLSLIYLLGMQNKPRPSGAQTVDQAQFQSAIEELLHRKGGSGESKNLFKDTDRLIAMFYNYPGGGKLDDDLPNNPFAQTNVNTHPEVLLPIVPNNTDDQERLRKAADSFATLKLESIMMGKRPLAMINKKIVSVGAKVGDFTVTSIESARVVVTFAGANFELKLQQPALEKE